MSIVHATTEQVSEYKQADIATKRGRDSESFTAATSRKSPRCFGGLSVSLLRILCPIHGTQHNTVAAHKYSSRTCHKNNQLARATRHSRHRADAASARLFQRLEKKATRLLFISIYKGHPDLFILLL